VLNAGERVVMLVGAGALHARDDVLRVADLLASPIIKTLPGKAAVPDRHPFVLGGIDCLVPLLRRRDGELRHALHGGYQLSLYQASPGIRQMQGVQIEADPTRAGNRIATDVPLVGDAKETLAALAPMLESKSDHGFLNEAQANMKDWREKMDALESIEHDPIQPQHLMKVIDRLADGDAILSSDSGTNRDWAARHFDIRDDRAFYLSGNLASMAPGLPYAIASQVAFPNRQCIAFVGDGGLADADG